MSPPDPREVPVEDDEDISYEAARDELIDVVRRLEAGGVSLEDSLTLWERGERLAGICQRWLDGARARLQAATPDAGAAGDSSDAGDSGDTEASSDAEVADPAP